MFNVKTPMSFIQRISLNQKTTIAWTLREAAEASAHIGFKWFGARIDALRNTGLSESVKILNNCGLNVSSVCYSGMFVSSDPCERKKRISDCLRAIDDTATVGSDVLVIIPGTEPRTSVEECCDMIDESIKKVLPYAEKAGVILGIEPVHPIYSANLSVIVTLRQAIDIIERFDSAYLKLIMDVFHTWWDPGLYEQLKRATGHICGYHVNDWVPIKFGINSSRGMMGDGMIPLRKIRAAVEEAGYFGPIEVEIFNEDLWHMHCKDVLKLCKERYERFV